MHNLAIVIVSAKDKTNNVDVRELDGAAEVEIDRRVKNDKGRT
jgi:hypothetical protein